MNTARTIVSLNGTWDLAFDDKNVGKNQKWFDRFPAKISPMQVPGVWEQVRPFYDGYGWYRKIFDAPKNSAGKTVRLKFGAVAYLAEVWLNGHNLGIHEGGYTPFEFNISRFLRAAANELIVRVLNPSSIRTIDGFRAGAPLCQSDLPYGKGAWYFNFGGIWQDVELIVSDKTYTDDIYVQPHPFQKKAIVNITIHHAGEPGRCTITCSVADRGQEEAPQIVKKTRIMLKRGENKLTLPMRFKDVHFWSPDDPHLYVATVALHSKTTQDLYSVRFGMREFVIRGSDFLLNRKKIKLVGFLQQGMYARTLCYPDTRAMGVRELKLLKDNGFNFIRAHLKPPVPWYADLCDEMGFIVEAEPAIGWISKSPQIEGRCRNEIQGLIRRDRNHPSIVMWCLLNEAYHFRTFTWAEIKRMVTNLSHVARSVDNSRLLMDTSGGQGGPLDDGTALWLPYVDKTVNMMDIHGYCPMPLRDSSIVQYRTMGKAGVPLLNSEYGAPDIPPDFAKVLNEYTPAERKLGLEDYKLHKDFYDSFKEQFHKAGAEKVFKNPDKMIAAIDRTRTDEMRLITMAQRSNPKLSGLALCQLADASGEIFGALDVWRHPKQLWHGMVAAAKKPLLVTECLPRTTHTGTPLALRATLVNDDLQGPTYQWQAQILSRKGEVVHSAEGTVQATKEVQTLLSEKAKLDLAPGEYQFRGTLTADGKTLSNESMAFTVLPRPTTTVKQVATWENAGHGETTTSLLPKFLAKHGIATDRFSNGFRNKNIPVLMDFRHGNPSRGLLTEYIGQLKKIVQTGGSAILFDPEPLTLYEYLFPTLIRTQGIMRIALFNQPHPIFDGLPHSDIVSYPYAEVCTDHFDRGADVLAAGGQILWGGFIENMWTRPACFFWGAGIYTVPIGRGQVIVCYPNVLGQLGKSPIAENMLLNLINYAASVIKPGGEDLLRGRCIDPINPADLKLLE